MSVSVVKRLFRPKTRPTQGQVKESPPVLFYVIVTLALASLMTVGRAYNTQDLSIFIRASLWIIVFSLIVGQVLLIEARLKKLPIRFSSIPVVRGFTAIVATSFLVTVELDLLKYTPLLPKKHDPFWEFLVFTSVPVTCIGGFILIVRPFFNPAAMGTRDSGTIELEAIASPSPDHNPAPLNSEVRFDIDGSCWPIQSIKWVHAQEHYLEIGLENNVELVRGRMSDALEQLNNGDGIQLHRSWWVAAQEIDDFVKKGRDYKARLKSGALVPVARSRTDQLKKTGYIT